MRSGKTLYCPSRSMSVALSVAFLAGAGGALGQSTQSERDLNCASALEKPTYPRLARIASISGSGTAHFAIGPSGRADLIRIDGHPILGKELDSSVRRTAFPSACAAQTLNLTFDFRLQGEPSDQARTSVVFEAPDKYIITSNATGIICALQTEAKRPPNTRRSCSSPSLFTRRIVSNMGIVEFRVPRSASVTKSSDVDYVMYHIRYGSAKEKLWLTMWFGPAVGGQTPHQLQDSSVKWSASKWSCSSIEGGDWKGTAADGRRWRHINVPLSGFAAYEGVPPKAADYFDKILDSMCCGKCDACR